MDKNSQAIPGDPHNLTRFIDAQDGIYEQALNEIRAGRKQSHWMWFIFPQIAGLGFSAMSQRYAIQNVAEAEAYLRHPVLGSRLRACFEALRAIQDRSAHDIFGSPDDMKLKSSATLFERVSPAGSVFEQVLKQYFGGQSDEQTLRILGIKK